MGSFEGMRQPSAEYLIDPVDLFNMSCLEVISGNSRTMVWVSENYSRVEQYCRRSIVFQKDRAPPDAPFWRVYVKVREHLNRRVTGDDLPPWIQG